MKNPYHGSSGVDNYYKMKDWANTYAYNAPKPQTLEDWEKYAGRQKPSGSGTWRTWRGGYLTPQEYSKVQYLEQQGLENEYKTAYDQAKAANEQRYDEIKGGYQNAYTNFQNAGPAEMTFDQAMFDGLGNQSKKDAKLASTYARASGVQSLVNSGLVGTSTMGAVNSRVNRDYVDSIGRINDNLRREQMGYKTDTDRFNAVSQNDYNKFLSNIDLSKLGFMERREDEYPDQALYAKLAQSLGNA